MQIGRLTQHQFDFMKHLEYAWTEYALSMVQTSGALARVAFIRASAAAESSADLAIARLEARQMILGCKELDTEIAAIEQSSPEFFDLDEFKERLPADCRLSDSAAAKAQAVSLRLGLEYVVAQEYELAFWTDSKVKRATPLFSFTNPVRAASLRDLAVLNPDTAQNRANECAFHGEEQDKMLDTALESSFNDAIRTPKIPMFAKIGQPSEQVLGMMLWASAAARVRQVYDIYGPSEVTTSLCTTDEVFAAHSTGGPMSELVLAKNCLSEWTTGVTRSVTRPTPLRVLDGDRPASPFSWL